MASFTNQELGKAILRLYTTFRAYRPELPIASCTEQLSQVLITKPLNELESEALWQVATSTHSIEISTLKYFLPRLLEIISTHECPAFESRSLFEQLRFSDFDQWPSREREAVCQWAQSWWKCILCRYIAWLETTDTLNALVMITDDLDPFLQIWDSQLAEGEAAGLHLADLIAHNHKELERRGEIASWQGNARTAAQFVEWLVEPSRQSRVCKFLKQWQSIPENIPDSGLLESYDRICRGADKTS